MAEPHLPSLVIEGFRGFKKLELRKLGHVNLLVGKNGVGKSSVLEAIRLYASQASPQVLFEMLASRDVRDVTEKSRSPRSVSLPEVQSLFHDWPKLGPGKEARITIGPPELPAEFFIAWPTLAEIEKPPAIAVRMARSTKRRIRVDGEQIGDWIADDDLMPSRLVPSIAVNATVAAKLWDNAVLKGRERHIIEALRLVHSGVENIVFVGETWDKPGRRAIVKLKGQSNAVPLRLISDGAWRMLGILVSLIDAQDGFLLVDEFENGLHYSVQGKIWELVFEAAREFNVQVFATTHSEDCVRAFAVAANKDAASLGIMTKLVEQNGQIVAKQLMEEDVLAGAQGLVEMR